jgi:hypothetical protein
MNDVVAFLQNQWFPAKSHRVIEHAYARHASTPEGRAELNARYLFFRCKTGQQLKRAFPDALIERVAWENCTTQIGSEASSKLPPDPAHIEAVLRHFRPRAVIAFGCVAIEAVGPIVASIGLPSPVIPSYHPAARHANVVNDLRIVARMVAEILSDQGVPLVK